MSRPRKVVPVLCALGMLLAAGCRSSGNPREPRAETLPPVTQAQAAAPDARAEGDGWVWTAPPPAWIGLPAADNTHVTFTYGHEHLVLLDADGRRLWDASRPGLRDVAPRLGPQLVVAATDDGLTGFRRADGVAVWDTPVGGRANTPVIAGGLAVTSTWEGSAVAVDLAGGRIAWTVTLPGPALGPPATDGTAVVFAWDRADKRSGGVVALEAATGRQRWAVQLPGAGVSAPAVVPGGPAVLVAGDLAAHALAMSSGAEVWRTPLAGAGSAEVPPFPVDASSVLVAHRLGGLDLLDAKTGRRTWEVATDGAAVRGGPVVGQPGHYAFPLDDGRVLLAGPSAETRLVRPPAGRVSGLAVGPRGWLVGSTREAKVNTVEAGPNW